MDWRDFVFYNCKSREAFESGKKNYGALKIKKYLLDNYGLIVSKRRIRRIMKQLNLISTYQCKSYKNHTCQVNESLIGNELNREFTQSQPLRAIVTDLTYVKVNHKWHYVCVIMDLFNREIIGYSAGKYKNSELVLNAFKTIPYALNKIHLFHTDRGKEFDNKTIDTLLSTFNIKRSLSHKGCPYDNAVAESTYKSFKTEFIYQHHFKTLEQLQLLLFDFVNWWNHVRYHGGLNYETPIQFKKYYLNNSI